MDRECTGLGLRGGVVGTHPPHSTCIRPPVGQGPQKTTAGGPVPSGPRRRQGEGGRGWVARLPGLERRGALPCEEHGARLLAHHGRLLGEGGGRREGVVGEGYLLREGQGGL